MGMNLMSPAYLAGLLATKPPEFTTPEVFIETGTFQGKTAMAAAELHCFDAIHTIELSPEFHRAAESLLAPLGVRCHCGDSAGFLEDVLNCYPDQPVVAYLDAHWFWREEHHPQIPKDNPFPLWAELAVIRRRPNADCVIVDDVQIFGKGSDDWAWPLDDQWKGVMPETILDALDRDRIAWSDVLGDAFVVWRNPKGLEK